MKMGNRKNKFLDRMGTRIMNKPDLTAKPSNRAERRALARLLKQAPEAELRNTVYSDREGNLRRVGDGGIDDPSRS